MKLIALIQLYVLISCSQGSSSPQANQQKVSSSAATTTSNLSISPQKKKAIAKDPYSSQDTGVPQIGNIDFGANFNQKPINTDLSDPLDEGFDLRISFTNIYRAIFQNLNVDVLENGTGFGIFEALPASATGNVALHESYHNLGYTFLDAEGAKQSINPAFYSPVITIIGGDATPAEKADILMPPETYLVVFSQQNPSTADLSAYCDSVQPKPGDSHIPSFQVMNFCGTMLTQSTYQVSVDPYAQSSITTMLEKRSVRIWRPIPLDGYGCLGYVATNGEKPSLEIDAAGAQAGAGYQSAAKLCQLSGEQDANGNCRLYSDNAATYCLKLDYLLPGKAGKKLAESMYNGKMYEIYEVVPKDPYPKLEKSTDAQKITDFNTLNLRGFIVKQPKEKLEDISMWVPNYEKIRVIPPDSSNP